jgi:hypothetical protein
MVGSCQLPLLIFVLIALVEVLVLRTWSAARTEWQAWLKRTEILHSWGLGRRAPDCLGTTSTSSLRVPQMDVVVVPGDIVVGISGMGGHLLYVEERTVLTNGKCK